MDARIENVLKMPLYQRVLLLLGVSALIIAGYVYFLHLPAQDELAKQIAQNDKVMIQLQENRRIANNLPRFKAEYEKMQQQLELALNELPNESEIPSLLSNIAGLAKDNGLEVKEFKPENEVPQGFYAKVPVSLKLNGSYHEMALFCQAVSNLDRIVNIENIALGKAETTDVQTQLAIDCSVVTYRFIENPPEAPSTKGKNK
ncbi:MAG: type 4a pilus biogenesis protein PilO [Desulfuromonas sp.]|nr:type 4a pilus biogenesis protein PilO [Desulfuromonas sp.]